MARPKAFDPDQTLVRAMELFWEKGFSATSMRDLVDRLGVNKRSLYETYGDKAALYQKALARYRRDIGALLYDPLLHDTRGVEALLENMKRFEQYVRTPAGKRGCLVTNCVLELGSTDRAAADLVRAHLEHLERSVRAALDRAAIRGELREPRGNAERARLLVSIVQGLFVLARSGGADRTIRSTLRATEKLIRSW